MPVHATGEEAGCHYYAMELIAGQPLSGVLRDLTGQGSNPLMDETVTKLGGGEQAESKPNTTTSQATSGITSLSDHSSGSRKWFDAVAKLIAEVADALEYAHGRGVIHRDIKPANLMLSKDGRLCVTDFGLARVAQEPGMTVSGSLMGTPAYMSPEQIAVGRVKLDHRTDVYSLGAVLYEMLTHRRPFPGDSREEILSGILTKDPRPPRRFNPRIPVDLETICQKAMEKDPDRRYPSAGEFANDLRQYLQRRLIAAKRASLPRRAWKSIRRHPVAAVSILAVIAVLSIGGVAWNAMRKADLPRKISEAELLVSQGGDRAALQVLDEVLVSDPASVAARLLRARVFIHQWHFWDAVEEGRAVLRQEPDNWEAHLLIAAAAKRGGLYSVPVDEHLAAVEGRVPDTAEAYFLRGWIATLDDQYYEALEQLDRALELDPGHALALWARSDTHAYLKNFQAALADGQRLVTARPRSAKDHRHLGFVYREFHDEKRALEILAKAIDLDPEEPITYYTRASLHRDSGRTAEQIADLTRAIELDPEFAWACRSRGDAYLSQSEYDLAIADYRRAIGAPTRRSLTTQKRSIWRRVGPIPTHRAACSTGMRNATRKLSPT